MGVEEMDPSLRQLYLQKPYVKSTKKASLLATIYEEPVQKTKSKEPQLMAARGLKRYLDFESQAEFAKRRRKREARALSHQIQKQRERLAQAEPETQVNACGRPKRRAASVSEAATKVMTILDAPPKGSNHVMGKEYRQDMDESYIPSRWTSARDNCKVGDSRRESDKDKVVHGSRETRRRIVKPVSRIPKEVREALCQVVDVVATVDKCVENSVIACDGEADDDVRTNGILSTKQTQLPQQQQQKHEQQQTQQQHLMQWLLTAPAKCPQQQQQQQHQQSGEEQSHQQQQRLQPLQERRTQQKHCNQLQQLAQCQQVQEALPRRQQSQELLEQKQHWQQRQQFHDELKQVDEEEEEEEEGGDDDNPMEDKRRCQLLLSESQSEEPDRWKQVEPQQLQRLDLQHITQQHLLLEQKQQ